MKQSRIEANGIAFHGGVHLSQHNYFQSKIDDRIHIIIEMEIGS